MRAVAQGMAISDAAQAVLLAVFILATSVWVGGYVAIALVVRAAAATLDSAGRVVFFQSLGRSYLWIGVPALVVALSTGAVLLRDHDWDVLLAGTVTVATIMVACLAIAVAQARRMTRLRRRALDVPHDEHLADRVRRGARTAGVLRAAVGLLSLALMVLGSFLAT